MRTMKGFILASGLLLGLGVLLLQSATPVGAASACGECEEHARYTVPTMACRQAVVPYAGYSNCCPSAGTSDYSELVGDNKCDNSDPDVACSNDKSVSVAKLKFTVTGSNCNNPCPDTSPGSCAHDWTQVGTHTLTDQCSTAKITLYNCTNRQYCADS